MIVASKVYDQFAEQGYTGPIRVLSAQECQRFLQAIRDERRQAPLDWFKGHATSSRAFYEIGTHPAIVEMVVALLGEDVMLWGASIVERFPDAIHPWHSDTETATLPLCKSVSVWMGIENTTRDSSLQIIPYSHRFGATVQEVAHHLGKGRNEATDDNVARWAQELDKRSHLLTLAMNDGEALFFDGHLWHGSHNLLRLTRKALLLQYATVDAMVRMPDSNYLDWPFRQVNVPRPACLMIRGSDKAGVNRIVSAPMAASAGFSPQLTSRVYPLRIPLPADKGKEGKAWKSTYIFNGSTADLRSLSCHVSELAQGHIPHPPHAHKEEELLLLLSGEVDIIHRNGQTPNEDQRKRAKPGHLFYYPAHFAHTLQTVGEDPATYLMFKWYTDTTGTDSPLPFVHLDLLKHMDDLEIKDGFYSRPVFEGPTAYMRKLHCHASTLSPGAGYEPHIDAYDVAIIVLEGEVETLGERVGPHGVIFYPAGEPHGIHNPGETIAKYVVFEFHSSQTALANALPPSLLAKLRDQLTDPERRRRKLKHLVKWVVPESWITRLKPHLKRLIKGV